MPAHFPIDAAATAIQPSPQQIAQNEPDADGIAAVPNRPTFATTALTVQRGVLEIEYGFQGDRAHQNINGVVKFGIFNSLELRFAQNPIEIDSGIASTGDCGIGFKWKFLVQHQARAAERDHLAHQPHVIGVDVRQQNRADVAPGHTHALPRAIERAYQAVDRIRFDGMHFRRDIGRRKPVAA